MLFKFNNYGKHEKNIQKNGYYIIYYNNIIIQKYDFFIKLCNTKFIFFKLFLAEINLDKGGRHLEVEGKENRSVFVSNLDFAVTELEVKDALSSIGHCEVLLVRDFKGRSKGFGYVLFEKPVRIVYYY